MKVVVPNGRKIKIMFSDVEIKLKKRNKVLFSRDSKCLQDLVKLIQLQNHRILVMWAWIAQIGHAGVTIAGLCVLKGIK